MVVYAFNTGDIYIEYLKIEGENAILKVCLEYLPQYNRREDITKKVVRNDDYRNEVHSLIESYEQEIRDEYFSECHNENQNDYANN